MGYDCSASAIIGVQISGDKIFIPIACHQPTCEHKVPSHHKFCPECGKPVKIETQKCIFPIDTADGYEVAAVLKSRW